ncbi:piggyBac transposable element-derived protein 4-like isoform X2 [Vespa velutina]|uniref:piggyBac transposable element-derived protein 4-like isoform X2 n=1 Tax=Vespa velutina TaxID=202808 RepID=UPI001FB24058|nr:piggyBac transposable element-derived protein 4-like isoform X2 [Vespa velutina]XP_047360349.1 piggyBac transposable element-derived protein 4-like isoform X2 [Vespa velutina]XP_047360351.1 piggyBac transposable element-derived protein 4-like isoform X2 [Vespa velutina]
MADERDDTIIYDECADVLSDVPDDFADWEEDDGYQKNESEAESSEDSEIPTRKIRRTLQLPTDSDESDKEDSAQWSDFDLPRTNNKFEGSPGPNIFPKDTQSVEDIVELYIGNDLFEYISNETNKYYSQNCNKRKLDKKNPKFVDVTALELRKWFGLVILMGIVKKARIDDYWSTNPLIDTPIFRKTMSRNRFKQILSFLHFSDNNKKPDNADRLFKVQFIINYFSKKFKENFNPSQNISIDEGIIPWRGRLNFKVYNPSKITKYGILIRMLCDSITGYISSFKIYSGVGQPLAKTVMELLAPSYGKWHHLYMDTYYNSVELAGNLLEKKIRVCGTIRQNRGFPEKLKRVNVNVFEACHQRKGEVLALVWRTSKTKTIRMISTIHNATLTNTQTKCRKTNYTIKKPESVLDYNKYMKRVDWPDQYLSYYPIYRKTIKWSKKVCMYLFNCALFNAFRTYQYFNTEHKSLRFHDFLLKVSDSWIKYHVPASEQNLEVAITTRKSHHDPVDRLSGHIKQHQLVLICETNKRKRRNCHVCSKNKKRKITNLMCKSCGVALHLGDCFAAYHTKEKY